MTHYFGTDGIRGRANRFPMDPLTILKVGLAAGSLFRNLGLPTRVVVGKDTRLSGYMVEPALTAGLTAMGMEVFLLGPLPTPAVSMLVRSLRADLGIMISASHNGFEDNGLKFFGPSGHKLSHELEKKIEAKIQEDLSPCLVAPVQVGRAKRIEDAHARYVEYVKSTLARSMRLDGIKIVLDCAHGAAYKAAPEVLWELGATLETIHHEPNGLNINKACGSTSPEKLQELVCTAGADIGIALDGDADRLVVVDETGEVVSGDQLLGLLAFYLLKDGLLSSRSIVGTIISNVALEAYLSTLGLTLIRTPVGDRNVMECMTTGGHNLGGEPSGHFMLGDYATTGDALLTAVQILSYLKRSGQRASQLCRPFELIPQENIDIVFDHGTLPDDACLDQAAREGSAWLQGNGRCIVRRSGTQSSLIRVTVESPDAALRKWTCANILNLFKVSYS